MRSMKRSSVIALVAIAFAGQSLAAEIIHGRVVDGGARGLGIPAVTVNIEDKDGKLLKAALTDGGGHYRLEVPASARYASFDKLKYQNRSARRTLQPGAAAQADVILVAEGRPAAYYRAVASAFKESGQAQAPQYAATVASLPPAERKLVTDALTLQARPPRWRRSGACRTRACRGRPTASLSTRQALSLTEWPAAMRSSLKRRPITWIQASAFVTDRMRRHRSRLP